MNAKEFTIDAAKIVPPATTTTLTWAGVHVPEIIQFCTLIYAVGLAVRTLYKFWMWAREKRAARIAP
jgi:hypothetical protein